MGNYHRSKKPWLIAGLLAGGVALSGCGPEDDESSSNRNTGPAKKEIYIELKDQSVQEMDEKHLFQYTVALTGSPDSPVTLDYATSDGTAIAGEDYESQSGSITFPPGTSRATIEIPILGDDIREPDEYFEVSVSNIKNAKVDKQNEKAAITIVNDDGQPTVSFEIEQQSVAESIGTINVTALLSQQSGYPVEVELEKRGTATEGDDYIIGDPLTLEFSPGDVEASLEVLIIDDDIPEGGETIKFKFGDIREAGRPGREEHANHTIIILGDTALNDTGLVTYSDGHRADHPEPNGETPPGQDAEFGRDADSSTSLDGHAGFRFAKISKDGRYDLPPNAREWRCTRDEVTGLVWENKSAPKSTKEIENEETGETRRPEVTRQEFRATNFTYGWHSDVAELNGGSVGMLETGKDLPTNPVGDECGYEIDAGREHTPYCHTKSYIQEMNLYEACGFSNWRMPTIEELRSLANHSVTPANNSAPDERFFSNVRTDGKEYFSATPYAYGAGAAWCYDYGEGKATTCKKRPTEDYRAVMAVRDIVKGEEK